MLKRALFFAAMTFISMSARASFYDLNPESWVWYRDGRPIQLERKSLAAINDRQYLLAIGQKMEQYEAAAIVNPSVANIYRVIYWRKKILVLAKRYADAYEQYIWAHPEDDFSLQVAQRSDAIVATAGTLKRQQDAALAKMAQQFAIIYVFRSDCKFCQKFSIFLSRFKEQYGFHVLAYSLDGRPLPLFPMIIRDHEFLQRHRLHPVAVPAVYLVNPRQNKIITIGYGLMNLLDLRSRIVALLKLSTKSPVMTWVGDN